MPDRKPPAEVGNLIRKHAANQPRKLANEVTVGKRMMTRKPQRAPKPEPSGVLALIARYARSKK